MANCLTWLLFLLLEKITLIKRNINLLEMQTEPNFSLSNILKSSNIHNKYFNFLPRILSVLILGVIISIFLNLLFDFLDELLNCFSYIFRQMIGN